MSKYTKESPFEFEGVRIYRLECGEVSVGRVPLKVNPSAYTDVQANALHAFIEAERNEWHWTNADKTEARKGRWMALPHYATPGVWVISHIDFNAGLSNTANGDYSEYSTRFTRRADEARDDFLAWHAAQQQPEEPTGLGAVVEVEGRKYVRNIKAHDHDDEYWRNTNGLFFDWSELTSRGPVTVLSAGVES